jgi:hypothetical protein
MLQKDLSLQAQWEAATGFDIHDRSMIWNNYSYFAYKDDQRGMDLEERIMRAILVKIKLSGPVNLRKELMQLRRELKAQ